MGLRDRSKKRNGWLDIRLGVFTFVLLGVVTGAVAAAESKIASVEGTVVDVGGKPVAGVDLFFTSYSLDGNVVATTCQSDATGHFKLPVCQQWLDLPLNVRVDAGLIAMKEGSGYWALGLKTPATLAIFKGNSVLSPPEAKAAIRVLDPEGRPVPNAKVSVSAVATDALNTGLSDDEAKKVGEMMHQRATALYGGHLIGLMSVPLPDVLKNKLSATTDREGNAVIPGIGRKDIAGIDIVSEKFGHQNFSRNFAEYLWAIQSSQAPLVEFPQSVSLKPVGSLSGRLAAESGGVSGVRLQIVSAELPIFNPRSEASESRDHRLRQSGLADVVTDEEGQFSVSTLAVGTIVARVKMPPQSPLRAVISAAHPRIELGKKTEITIPLVRAVRATGTVRDAESGKPLADWPLEVVGSQYSTPEMVRTDADGCFQCLVPPGTVLQMPVLRDGFIGIAGAPNRVVVMGDVPAGKETCELPAVELTRKEPALETAAPESEPKRPAVDPNRYRTLAGRVVDCQAAPVSGATVFQSLAGPEAKTAMTDADGRFRLEGVWEGTAFVFASKDGFRLSGRLVEGLPDNTELVLARTTEPPLRVLKTLPLTMPRPERLTLARRLIAPAIKQAQTAKDPGSKMPVLQALGRVDPAQLLELLDAKAVSDTQMDQMLRGQVAIHLAKESPDDALAIVESMTDPSCRSMVYLALADAAGAERKLKLVSQALVQARANNDPSFKACGLGIVGKQLLALGKPDQAAKVLREGEVVAKQLPPSEFGGYARGVLATELAPMDLAAALDLIKGLTDPSEHSRHHGNIAHKIAGKQPAEAERVLAMIRGDDSGSPSNENAERDRYAVRVCYRMATVDLPRTRQIAAAISDPYQKAQAYGVMAQALATTQPEPAIELLRQAFGELEQHVGSGKDSFNRFYDAPSVAGLLLKVAEMIDPKLINEFLWRAIALRQIAQQETASPQWSADTHLAATLARYDRQLAGILFEPAWQNAVQQNFLNANDTLIVAALLKPQEASAAVEKMSDAAQGMEARRRLAGALAGGDDDVWEHLLSRLLGIWKVDDEDLGEME